MNFKWNNFKIKQSIRKTKFMNDLESSKYISLLCSLCNICCLPSLLAQLVKNPPAMQEIWAQSLGWEDPLEKGKATHLVFWPGEFHRLYSPWGHRE